MRTPGARESEALWLTWDDVRLEERFMWIDSSRDGWCPADS